MNSVYNSGNLRFEREEKMDTVEQMSRGTVEQLRLKVREIREDGFPRSRK